MKRASAFFIIILALAFPAMARRVMWGVQTGWDTRRIKLDSELFRVENRSGWYVGPQASLQMARGHLALEASLLYNQRNMDFEESDTHDIHTNRLSYLVLPLNLRCTIRIIRPLGIFISTGPQWKRYIGRNQHVRLEDEMDLRLDPSTLSWNAGAGVEIFRHLLLSATYNFAIDQECWKKSLGDAIRNFDIKRNSCQVSLTCLF
ncbi:MAG: porin family protein [Bacteroidaceae bacterium]